PSPPQPQGRQAVRSHQARPRMTAEQGRWQLRQPAAATATATAGPADAPSGAEGVDVATQAPSVPPGPGNTDQPRKGEETVSAELDAEAHSGKAAEEAAAQQAAVERAAQAQREAEAMEARKAAEAAARARQQAEEAAQAEQARQQALLAAQK